jgi:hypothetical protein
MGERGQDKVAGQSLAEARAGDRVYRLMRYDAHRYGVTRNDVPLVFCDYEADAREMFELLAGAIKPQPPVTRRGRKRSTKR